MERRTLTLTVPLSLVPFVAPGAAAVIAGGIAAAVTGPTGWERGSWVAAFLVLVVGVGQIGLGAGQAIFAAGPPSRRRIAIQVAMLNVGSLCVLTGTLAAAPGVVTAGGLTFAGALVMFVRTPQRRGDRWAGLSHAYTALLVVLLVSTPIGLALAWFRA
jgi:hypothetical protein